ncbi:C2H2 finger domain transcription factor con7 [Conoideocrella luteorostrata]|uniref:C2H2 finger domain transcription factor con7 n=1 Tax=Conoideocrella luteorostrata TaxID=1105319 RepID=A0AAJ0CWF0_9HYPO|nr:C2H2 finger domain transcription factor con7 [Conoideocrella luteorostrata]
MDRSAPEYSQSGLPSPYPSNYGGDNHSEGSIADHASAAHYSVKQEVSYPTSATPTSEYSVYPQSARSGTFPEHIQRSYHPASSPSSGGMAQQQNSPSFSPQDGRNHQAVHSDNGVPIDPSIAAPSPTYPYPPPQASPYAPNPDMSHSYSHPNSGMYAQPRPDWTGYGQHGASPLTAGHPNVYAQSPASAPPQQRPSQVYSFVPIPGAQQHKRPRRRYEEIERMYKCGWNGCEKAYGTLNHLNAHVTMQSHGQKRTPEEFKEIRKEWKQRKKEEEAQRKAEEERHRAAAAAQNGGPDHGPDGTPTSTYPGSRAVQLPPIGYQPTQYPAPPSGGVPQQGLPDYGNSHLYSNYQPHSPYGQPNQNMYSQSNGGQPNH